VARESKEVLLFLFTPTFDSACLCGPLSFLWLAQVQRELIKQAAGQSLGVSDLCQHGSIQARIQVRLGIQQSFQERFDTFFFMPEWCE